MDRRLFAGIFFLLIAALSWYAHIEEKWDQASDLSHIVGMLSHNKYYLGDKQPTNCPAQFESIPVAQARFPWKNILQCRNENGPVIEFAVHSHGGEAIDQVGPIELHTAEACSQDFIKKFAQYDKMSLIDDNHCYEIERPLGDGQANVRCCEGQRRVTVRILSQLTQGQHGVFDDIDQQLQNALVMSGGKKVHDAVLNAIFDEKVKKRHDDLEKIQVDISARNNIILQSLFNLDIRRLLQESYGTETAGCVLSNRTCSSEK